MCACWGTSRMSNCPASTEGPLDVFPSLFESFGIPVVEAMACGTLAVVSSHPSLDEASGDVGIRVEPSSPEAIAAGIEQALAGDPASIAVGLEHARRFTWRACGEAMLRGYENASR